MALGQKSIVDLPGAAKDEGDRKSPKPAKPTPTADRDLKSRLAACFERIAAAADARGDEELAEILREDRDVMANGIVSLTTPFRALRTPILFVLGIVEPVMAFSRVTRMALERYFQRRADRQAAREEPPA